MSTMLDLMRRREFPIAAFLAASVLAYGVAPTSNGNVTCLLRIHAGQACPVCGMSRATGRFFNGDLVGAFAYHPWVFAIVLQVVAFAAWRYRWGNRPMLPKHHLRLVWSISVNMVLLVGVWGIRILTGHLANVY